MNLATTRHLLALLVLLSPMPLDGQLRVEPRAGLSVSRILMNSDHLDFRTGSLGGMGLVIPLGPKVPLGPRNATGTFFLRPEALVIRKGGAGTLEGIELDIVTDYFEIPVGFGYETASVDNMRGRLYGGPTFAFQLKCTLRLSTPGAFGSVATDCDDPGLDGGLHTKAFDLGLAGNAGVIFGRPGRAGVTLDGGVEYSLTPMSNASAEPRHLAILLSAGLSVPTGERK